MRRKSTERAELSCHTWDGTEDGILRPHEWIDAAREAGVRAIAITDFQDVTGFKEAARAVEELRGGVEPGELDFKVLYGLETVLEDGCRIHLLVQRQEGLAQLYRLLELTWQGREDRPFLRKAEINKHRTGLLVGCPGEDGEVYRGVLEHLDDTRLEEIAGFYDYLSVLPPPHYKLLTTGKHTPCGGTFEAEDLIRKTIAIGRQSGKPVAAVGNMRTADQDWGMFRSSIAYGIRKEEGEGDLDTPLPDLLCTEEMLDAFSFLGKELAEEIVIHAPNRLADFCKEIRIFPEDAQCLQPILSDAFQTVADFCREQLQMRYGGTIPETVREQMEHELAILQNNELLCSILLISRRLVQGLQGKGYPIRTIALDFSFVQVWYAAYLLGVTGVNPLAARIPRETLGARNAPDFKPIFNLSGEPDVPLELVLSASEECWEQCWEAVIETFSQIFPKGMAVSYGDGAGWEQKPSPSYGRLFVPDAAELQNWMPLQKTDNGYRIPYGRAEDFSNLFRVFLRPHRAQVCDTGWEDLLEQLGFTD